MREAQVEDMDKIMGLTLGADDCVTKPFNPLELVAGSRRSCTGIRAIMNCGSMNCGSMSLMMNCCLNDLMKNCLNMTVHCMMTVNLMSLNCWYPTGSWMKCELIKLMRHCFWSCRSVKYNCSYEKTNARCLYDYN